MSRTMNVSSSSNTLRTIEDIKKSASDTKAGIQATMQKFWEELVELKARTQSNETRAQSSETIHAQHEKELAIVQAKLDRVKLCSEEEFRRIGTAFESLFTEVSELQDIALQYRPGNAAIVIRRELDDCRLFLADGFMVLFPAEYPYSKMLHKFNPVKAKIEWSNFRARLHSHFISCHEIDNTTFEIWQIHSAFRDCDLDAIIEDYEDTEKEFPVELEKYQPSEMPDASIFAKKYKGNFSPAHNRIEGLSDDAYVEQQLWLFIPLFIWAYNELKRALDVDDKRINELNLWIDSGKKAFRSPQDEMDETQKDLPNKDFTLGTGFELRKRRYWRSFLDSQRSGENVDQETHLPDHVQEQTTPSVAQAHVQTAHCAGAGLTNLPLFGTPQVTGAPQSHVQTAHGAPHAHAYGGPQAPTHPTFGVPQAYAHAAYGTHQLTGAPQGHGQTAYTAPQSHAYGVPQAYAYGAPQVYAHAHTLYGLPQYAQTPYGAPQAYTQSPYDVEGLLTYGAGVANRPHTSDVRVMPEYFNEHMPNGTFMNGQFYRFPDNPTLAGQRRKRPYSAEDFFTQMNDDARAEYFSDMRFTVKRARSGSQSVNTSPRSSHATAHAANSSHPAPTSKDKGTSTNSGEARLGYTVTDVMRRGTENMVKQLEEKMKKEIPRRTEHFRRFHALRRALLIMLDQKIYWLSVKGCSVVRTATNDLLHPNNEPQNKLVSDGLKRVQELVHAHVLTAKEASKEIVVPEGMDLDEEAARLKELVYDGNKYFDDRQDEVEKCVDSHLMNLNNNVHRDNNHQSSSTDLHVLMSWLEKFQPTSATRNADVE